MSLNQKENEALRLQIRGDFLRPSSGFKDRISYPRGGAWRPPRDSGALAPSSGVPSPGVPPVPPSVSLPPEGGVIPVQGGGTPRLSAPSLGFGQVVQLRASWYTLNPEAVDLLVQSDWYNGPRVIVGGRCTFDYINQHTDGVRLFATTAETPPATPPPIGAIELVYQYTKTRLAADETTAQNRQLKGGIQGQGELSFSSQILIPFPRFKLVMYYYVASNDAGFNFNALATFDIRELVTDPGEDISRSFLPHSFPPLPRVEFPRLPSFNPIRVVGLPG